jgi:hypothetical protein
MLVHYSHHYDPEKVGTTQRIPVGMPLGGGIAFSGVTIEFEDMHERLIDYLQNEVFTRLTPPGGFGPSKMQVMEFAKALCNEFCTEKETQKMLEDTASKIGFELRDVFSIASWPKGQTTKGID